MSPWLPTVLVIILTAVALTEAGSSRITTRSRRLWMASITLMGSLAIASMVWQVQRTVVASAALAGTTTLQEASNRERNGPTVSDLIKQVKALEDHIRELEAAKQVRTITTDNADKLVVYLRQFGNRRVIVSCIPDDLEAYQYANQLVNILKAGNWDAQGPQVTRIFGDVRAPGLCQWRGSFRYGEDIVGRLHKIQHSIPEQGDTEPSHTRHRNRRALHRDKAIGPSKRLRRLVWIAAGRA